MLTVDSDPAGLKWGLRACISEFPGNAHGSGLQNLLWVAEPPRTWGSPQTEGDHPGYTQLESVLVGHSQRCAGLFNFLTITLLLKKISDHKNTLRFALSFESPKYYK